MKVPCNDSIFEVFSDIFLVRVWTEAIGRKSFVVACFEPVKHYKSIKSEFRKKFGQTSAFSSGLF